MPRRTKDPIVYAAETAIETHVSAKIRLRRGLLGISQSDLARALGLTFQQVQKYERGSNRVSVGKLVRVAEILDVPLSFFFDGLDGVAFGGAATRDALGRRDLDLLRAWRAAPPAVAEAALKLLRTVGGAPPDSDDEDEEPDTRHRVGDDPVPLECRRPRRKRGAVWDPADVQPASHGACA